MIDEFKTCQGCRMLRRKETFGKVPGRKGCYRCGECLTNMAAAEENRLAEHNAAMDRVNKQSTG